MKKILLTTDFSENSKNAILFGLELAKKINAHVYIFNGYPILANPVDAVLDSETEQEYHKQSQRMLTDYVKEIKKATDSSLKIEAISKMGFDSDIMGEIIKSKRIDLVVMGTQGASGIVTTIIGSNTTRMITKLKCPILAVPKKAVFHNIKKAIYTTEFQFNDFVSLEGFLGLFATFKPKIVVTNVCTEEKKLKKHEEKMEWFEEIAGARLDYSSIQYNIEKNESILDGIIHAVQASKADMLVMSTINRHLFESLFHASVVKKVSYHTEIPLLAFHISENKPLN